MLNFFLGWLLHFSAVFSLTCKEPNKAVGCQWSQLSPNGLDLFFSHKKLWLNPVWKKNLFFVFLCFFALFLKNNACLHESTRLPHMVLIFLYESHILQICADKIAGHSSCIFFFSSWFIANWARPSAQYLNFLWAKMLQWKWAEEFKENFVFLFDWQKTTYIQEVSIYICIGTYFITERRCEIITHGTFCWLTPLWLSTES